MNRLSQQLGNFLHLFRPMIRPLYSGVEIITVQLWGRSQSMKILYAPKVEIAGAVYPFCLARFCHRFPRILTLVSFNNSSPVSTPRQHTSGSRLKSFQKPATQRKGLCLSQETSLLIMIGVPILLLGVSMLACLVIYENHRGKCLGLDKISRRSYTSMYLFQRA